MINVLVLCTGNSCRSVMGGALLNTLGAGRIKAFSAGSHPLGRINPGALDTLRRHGLPTEGYTSQSWDAFAEQSMAIVITVCDNAAGETCPAYLNTAVRVHWGLADPAHLEGTDEEIKAAFDKTYSTLERRIKAMLALPLEQMTSHELSSQLNEIGKNDDQRVDSV
ncbi:MAG: arsenate reductase ArsC [Gammaproteobacteria bacterium]|nr:arsenate reductase ArsC [Gammaproteobacteria bacterium]